MEEISRPMKTMIRSLAAAIMHCPAMEKSSSAWYSLVSAFCRARNPYDGRMQRIPTTITSTRKYVAKPSTISMPPKAVPGSLCAYTAPPIAASSAKMLKCPNAYEARLCRIGSSTINAVPIAVRMISGRKRTRSVALAPKLAGMRYLRLPAQFHPLRHVDVGLFQHARRSLAHRRQETLRVNTHPHHHHDQRHYRRPFAQPQVRHVMLHFGRGHAVEHPLVHPQHVAGREDHADGGPGRPAKVRHGRALQHQEFAHEVVQQRQPDAGQGCDQEDRGEPGRRRGHAAVLGNQIGR